MLFCSRAVGAAERAGDDAPFDPRRKGLERAAAIRGSLGLGEDAGRHATLQTRTPMFVRRVVNFIVCVLAAERAAVHTLFDISVRSSSP